MQMGAAIVAAVAGLLGAALGYLGQSLRTRQEHRWAIEAVKREVYAEFLRSISASYAQAETDYAQATAEAKSHHADKPETEPPLTDQSAVNSHQSDDPEDARLLAATTSIELLAKRAIHEEARALYERVRDLHPKIRADGPSAHKDKIDSVNDERLGLVKQFKKDLGIPTGDEPEHQSRIRRVLRRPGRSGTSGQPDQPSSS
jgi:hypothetical protein